MDPQELRRDFEKFEQEYFHEQDIYWNSLDTDTQQLVFCKVSRILYDTHLKDQAYSYRGTLYNYCGWGPEAYVRAQISEFLPVHNALYAAKQNIDWATKMGQDFNLRPDYVDNWIKDNLI
jgi:hypothetical protein